MNNIIKEQVVEVLTCMQDYFRWMYYDPKSVEKLNNRTVEHKGLKFNLRVREDGLYSVKILEKDIEVLVQPRYIHHPPFKDCIENTKYECKILNQEVIPVDILHIVQEAIHAFTSSFFTRTIAFCLFARLQPVSIDEISNDLMLGLNKKVLV